MPFQHPVGTPGHKQQEYILTVPKPKGSKKGEDTSSVAVTAGNIFQPLATRQPMGGALALGWKITYESVRRVLQARKPFLVNPRPIALKRGEPKKVCWTTGPTGADTHN